MPNIMPSLYDDISKLTCFSGGACQIQPIETGSSHQCFKVSYHSSTHTGLTNNYFVKYLTGRDTASTEKIVHSAAAKQGLAPLVIQQCENWLVCEFIDGTSLTSHEGAIKDKVQVALALMVKLHNQVVSENKLAPLNISDIIQQLLITSNLTSAHQLAIKHWLSTIDEQIQLLNQHNNLCICHGDVNFSNILIEQIKPITQKSAPINNLQKYWLLDYECASLAPAEFDLAMFIAINNLVTHVGEDIQSDVISVYQQLSGHTVNIELLNYYLPCCYLINGLWYQDESQIRANKQFFQLQAQSQLQCFDRFGLLSENLSAK